MNKTSLCSDVSTALSYMGNDSSVVDVSPMPLGMKAAHDHVVTADGPHARRKSLEEVTIVRLMNILKHPKVFRITL